MLNNKSIAVVVPAYNEEQQIGIVIETMPSFVDRIIVVNDKSSDATAKQVLEYLATHYNTTSTRVQKKEITRTYHNGAVLVLEEIN